MGTKSKYLGKYRCIYAKLAEGDSSTQNKGYKAGYSDREIHWQEKLAEGDSKNLLEIYKSNESDIERNLRTIL